MHIHRIVLLFSFWRSKFFKSDGTILSYFYVNCIRNNKFYSTKNYIYTMTYNIASSRALSPTLSPASNADINHSCTIDDVSCQHISWGDFDSVIFECSVLTYFAPVKVQNIKHKYVKIKMIILKIFQIRLRVVCNR